PVLDDMYDYCELEGLDIDTLIHEEGSGQMEINFEHGNPLRLADQVFYFKRTLRETALSHGIYGTFMAKPMAGEPGSSMHIHQSLCDVETGDNIFADAKGKATPRFHHYIAGLQKYLPRGLALIAPNVNSYRRLLPNFTNTSAPINMEWGYDNRTVGLRVPYSGRQGTRVENRLAGADANPYLAIAVSLACGYLGMQEQLEPRAPITADGYAQGHDLPSDLGRALDALENSVALKSVLGEQFVRAFTAVKRAEQNAHFRVISSWEREYLLL